MFKTTIKVNDVIYQLVITDQYDSFIKNAGTLINLRDRVWKEYTESIYYESK